MGEEKEDEIDLFFFSYKIWTCNYLIIKYLILNFINENIGNEICTPIILY